MEILEQLHIEPGALLVNVVGFLVLFLLLRKLAFRPIAEIIKVRGEHIAGDVREAEQRRAEAEQELLSVRQSRQQMLDDAAAEAEQVRRDARAESQEIVAQARAQAREREQQAEANIRRQQERALAELRGEVGGLAVELSKRLLRRSLDEEAHAALVDKVIQDIERVAASEGVR